MNAGADKVEFNYILYVLLNIKLEFLLFFFLSWNFILSLHQIDICLSCTLFFRSHGHQWKFNLEKMLAHSSLWCSIVCISKAVFVPDWIFYKGSVTWSGTLSWEAFFLVPKLPSAAPGPIICLPEGTLYNPPSLEEANVQMAQWPGWPQSHKLEQKWESKPFTPGYYYPG